MAEHTELRQIIHRKYQLETRQAELKQKQEQLEEALPQLIYEKRQADAAQLEYEGGGLRSFLDRLSGKREEKKEEYARAARAAAAACDALKRDLESVKAKLAQCAGELEILPDRETLFAESREQEYLRQQDALFCSKAILPLLEENDKLLTEARDWAENRHADFVPQGVQYKKSQALLAASARARQTCILLERIQECGFLLEIHAYFRNPDGYIAGAARQFGQQDRINYAIRAIHTTRGLIQELILQLTEE